MNGKQINILEKLVSEYKQMMQGQIEYTFTLLLIIKNK